MKERKKLRKNKRKKERKKEEMDDRNNQLFRQLYLLTSAFPLSYKRKLLVKSPVNLGLSYIEWE
jgi:hypothetical protein